MDFGYEKEQAIVSSLLCLGALLSYTIPTETSIEIPIGRKDNRENNELFIVYGLEIAICNILTMGHILD